MFVACGIWCLADVSSVSPSSEQRKNKYVFLILYLVLTPCDMNLPMLLKYCDHKQD